DHARHQRPSTTQRVSQPRTRRRVTGQATIPGLAAGLTGPLPPDGRLGGGWLVCSWPWRGMLGEPGPPAERERAADQGPVAADRPGTADLEVGPAELPLDLLVALLDPVAQAVQAHLLGQLSRRDGGGRRCPLATGTAQVGDQIPGGQL